MSSTRTLVSFVSCCALLVCAGFSQTACAPKQNVSVSEEVSRETGELDSRLAIDRELYLAATSPGNLVESDSLSVSELAEHRAAYGDSLELTSDPMSSLALPMGMLQLESVPGLSGEWNMPAPGSAEARRLAERHTREALCSAGETVCITSPYGVRRSSRRSHKGIDIRAPLGSPIMAFRSGSVVCAEYHRSYGYMVEIQQDDGILARYAHMSQILVREGDRVEPGLMIGRVGSTGRSTGPHLHFELLRDNRQMNPMVYLPTPKQVVTKGTEADAAAARKALSKSGHGKSKAKAKKTSSRSSKKKTAVKSGSSSKKSSVKSSSSKKRSTKATKSSSAKKKSSATSSKKKSSVKKTSASSAKK
ncbi:M23 family metallopeptidase [Mailhella sp.]|uniref:M23 family metallopeptidase n=1 Tax=Mailhella sp. TaxID=1981029 RepID=UPI003AB743B8